MDSTCHAIISISISLTGRCNCAAALAIAARALQLLRMLQLRMRGSYAGELFANLFLACSSSLACFFSRNPSTSGVSVGIRRASGKGAVSGTSAASRRGPFLWREKEGGRGEEGAAR